MSRHTITLIQTTQIDLVFIALRVTSVYNPEYADLPIWRSKYAFLIQRPPGYGLEYVWSTFGRGPDERFGGEGSTVEDVYRGLIAEVGQ